MVRSRALVAVAIAATLAVLAAVVVWLQSQDGGAPTTATAPPTSSQTTAPASDVVVVGSPGAGFVTTAPRIEADQVSLGQFSSPSGNIGCDVSADYAACEIGEHTFPLPPKPADCSFDWGAAVDFIDPTVSPTFGACKSDTQLGAPDQLAYGTATVLGDFACLSQEVGVTCWSQRTGHGFSLSRDAYALF